MPVALGVGVPFKSKFSGTVVDPGLALLQSAVLWLDASDMATNAQWLRNKGTGGRALDARVGSVGSAQIINGALKLPGTAPNQHASIPDAANLDITGDLEILAYITVGSITTNQEIVAKWNLGSNQGSYTLRIESGNLRFYLSTGGGDFANTVTAAHGLAIGDSVWVRVTRISSSGVMELFKAPGTAGTIPSSWTSLGSATMTTSNIFSSTSNLFIGQDGQGNFPFLGTIYRAVVRSTIGGSNIADIDFTLATTLASSFTCTTGQTVTITSASGVDTNDPLLLPHTGTNYLYLPGTNSNRASSPDSAALDITGDIEIVSRVAVMSLASPQVIAAKWAGGGQNSFIASVQANGSMILYISTTGSDFPSFGGSAGAIVAGTTVWLRFRRVASTGATTLEYAADQATEPTSWTSNGSGTISAGSNIFSGTSLLEIGTQDNGTNNASTLSVYRTIIRNGLGGTTVFDANFSTNTNQSSFTESSSNAATVTINRATSGRKAVMVVRPTLLFGTDDYLEVADNALLDFAVTDSFTVCAVIRQWNTPLSFGVIVNKKGGAPAAGWFLGNNGTTTAPYFNVADGSFNPSASGSAAGVGVAALVSGVRNTASDNFTAYVGSTGGTPTTDTNVASSANALVMRVGSDLGLPIDAEIMHVAVFRSALTSTQLGQIATYLGV